MYATVEQANAYVASYYSSTNNIRIAWEALNEEDKQITLNRSEQLIDLLPFNGKPVDPKQLNAFPRYPFISSGKFLLISSDESIVLYSSQI